MKKVGSFHYLSAVDYNMQQQSSGDALPFIKQYIYGELMWCISHVLCMKHMNTLDIGSYCHRHARKQLHQHELSGDYSAYLVGLDGPREKVRGFGDAGQRLVSHSLAEDGGFHDPRGNGVHSHVRPCSLYNISKWINNGERRPKIM